MAYLARWSWQGVAVAGLFVLASFYALYALTESPPTWYDEGLYIQVAQSIAHRGEQVLQVAPEQFVSSGFITGGFPFLAPIAFSLNTFGNTLFAARLPMAIFILLFLLVAWHFMFKAYGREAALLSLLLLATFPLIYGNGKNVLGEVPGLFYLTLSLFFLWRIEEKNYAGIASYIGAGFTAGLAVATKPFLLLLPLAIGSVILLRFRTVTFRWREIIAANLSFALPVCIWLYFQFGAGDSAGATLTYYANPYGIQSLGEIILANLLRFVTEATPIYCTFFVLLWVASVAVRFFRKEQISVSELSVFLFSLFILAAYLRTAGWYRYFFPALVLALLFAPNNLRVVWEAIRARIAVLSGLSSRVAVFAFCLCVGAFHLYQLNYSSWVAEHYQSTAAAELTAYFSKVPAEETLFVYNVPEVVPFIRSHNYYQYIATTERMVYGAAGLEALEQNIPDRVIVTAADYAKEARLFTEYAPAGQAGPYLSLARK